MTAPFRLGEHFVVLDRDFSAETIEVTDTLYAELDEKYDGFSGRVLVSRYSFASDWPTWEVHPAGDEFVYLLEGEADMILALPGGDETVRVREPGDFVIVPRGVWHTAKTNTATTMLFVTPGQGTINAEQPER